MNKPRLPTGNPSCGVEASAHKEGYVAVLFSGGLDSTLVCRRLLTQKQAVIPLYVRSGMFWENAEIQAVNRLVEVMASLGIATPKHLDVPVADVYGDHWSLTGRGVPDEASDDAEVYLPGRNLFLLAKAALWCSRQGVRRLAIGVLDGNPFGDATERFFRLFEQLIACYPGQTIEIVRPLAGMSKADIVRQLPLELAAATFSCLQPVEGGHCGQCNKCRERQRAFADAGMPDPTPYHVG
ncbi:MAG: 7-cyano-7-deazaguanine synthase [Planctomycetota bacterium]|nr:MAG: 7-cyano-7-deazaguanine synthase [Planctomycetota bacterium]